MFTRELGSMSVFDKLWIGCKLLIRHPMLYTKGSSAYYYPLDTVELNILVGEIMYSLLIPLAIIASVLDFPSRIRALGFSHHCSTFFGLAFAFMLNDTSFSYGIKRRENLPLKYRFATTWSAEKGLCYCGQHGWPYWPFLCKTTDWRIQILASIRLRFMGGLPNLFLGL